MPARSANPLDHRLDDASLDRVRWRQCELLWQHAGVGLFVSSLGGPEVTVSIVRPAMHWDHLVPLYETTVVDADVEAALVPMRDLAHRLADIRAEGYEFAMPGGATTARRCWCYAPGTRRKVATWRARHTPEQVLDRLSAISLRADGVADDPEALDRLREIARGDDERRALRVAIDRFPHLSATETVEVCEQALARRGEHESLVSCLDEALGAHARCDDPTLVV